MAANASRASTKSVCTITWQLVLRAGVATGTSYPTSGKHMSHSMGEVYHDTLVHRRSADGQHFRVLEHAEGRPACCSTAGVTPPVLVCSDWSTVSRLQTLMDLLACRRREKVCKNRKQRKGKQWWW
jgi:hypothetical protein